MASVNSAEREMNLSALQQRDPYITSIADSASQVAVYSFNSNIHEWEKTNVEGTLFVYSRSANPVNGFMIINRLHLNDLIEPINKNLEFQLQDPFLLYRNEKAAIYGIWFYDRDECARIGQLMNSLVQIAVETQQKESAIGRQRRASESDTTIDSRAIDAGKSIDGMQKNVDIMQMLSKAQDEYDKSKAQILRKSSTPTVTTNGNCATGVGACSTSPATRTKSISSSKPVQFDNLGGNGLKPGRVLRPTAVKPTPLQMDSLNRGEGMEPVTTPNTQISLEALFKRAVLHQNGNLQSNSYRNQHDSVQTVPSVAQLMSTQTGTTTVEELERQHQRNSHHADMLGSSASRAFANGAIFSHPLSVTSEPECLNTMLRRTLNIDSSLAEASGPSAMSRRQASVLEDCVEAPLVHNSARSASRGNDVCEIKASTDVAKQHQSDPISQMSLQMSRFGPRKPLDSSLAEMMGPPLIAHSGSSSLRQSSNSYKPGVIGSGSVNSSVWSNSPQSDILAPPEAFQAAAPKNDVANILLSPMVFQASSALSAVGPAKLPETDSANLSGLYPACLRSPLSLSMEPSSTLPVNPLTRDQLQQALIYLLKNDSNFLSTIHEAYITSLNQELGSKSMQP